ncbi:hypothetical protein NZ47_09085 [Anaerovibrio lipolyticus]|uniref:DUF4422 domain-containing protein n=1 Tax=Anaerovibrio lipolyticus TaxID=82374 RepID=A0A0B2K0L1_9FIRM|nr:DUF4422 domain-containing protein [Anaerovibrio lipolyticus]KHM51712.1 hypothetical protein NZ47_09085 [Anaerovibrio lipolyticus]
MSRKIALFGLGNELYIDDWSQETVVAVGTLTMDSTTPTTIELNDTRTVPVVTISQLTEMSFDFIIITDTSQFNNIYITCAQARIPQFKIISYDTYIHHVRNKVEYNVDDEQSLLKFIQEHQIKRVLDVDLYFADGLSTTRNRVNYAELNTFDLAIPDDLELLGIANKEYWPIWDNIYNRIYHKLDSILLQHFDLLLIMKIRSPEDYIQLINTTYGSWKYALIQVETDSSAYNQLKSLDYAGLNLKAAWQPAQNTTLLMLEYTKQNTEIYVICHKPYALPKLPGIYHPIHAGKNGHDGFGLPGDDTGENISFLNPYINELTAIYWMWKNTTSEIIGTAHYHRFFVSEPADSYISNSHNYLDERTIQQLLSNHDIILRRSVPYGNTEDCFRKYMGYDFYEAAKKIFLDVIKDVAPDYAEAFIFALSRHNCGHAFNMFITRRHVFDAYCSWLFPIILEAANRIDFTHLPNPPHSRIIGFMGEALLMPWLMKQRLRIKELPVAELSYNG